MMVLSAALHLNYFSILLATAPVDKTVILGLFGLSAILLVVILVQSPHPLKALLSLEGMGLLNLMVLSLTPLLWDVALIMAVFTLMVAEASLGLGVLINLSREAPSLSITLS